MDWGTHRLILRIVPLAGFVGAVGCVVLFSRVLNDRDVPTWVFFASTFAIVAIGVWLPGFLAERFLPPRCPTCGAPMRVDHADTRGLWLVDDHDNGVVNYRCECGFDVRDMPL
jgi:hypothetical protein